MNSSLYGNKYPFPEELKQHLRVCMRLCPDANPNIEGFRRNKELQSAKDVTYQQLKRMKNWFDNYQGKKEDAPYILNGGDKVKNWIDYSLGVSRKSIQTTQDRKKELGADVKDYVDIVPDSAKLTPSEDNNVNVMESLKRINQLMNKIL